MDRSRRFGSLLVAFTLAFAFCPGIRAETPQPGFAASVYASAKAKLVQISTVLRTANRQSAAGSGFLVDGTGTTVTNYHVISQYALEPDTYRLEYTTVDGRQGPVTLLAIDIAHDLALVHLENIKAAPFFALGDDTTMRDMPKGTALHALGNPLELGFTVIDGTYSGFVDRSYSQRLHFSGALNPGMSGGPTVTDDGRVAGINVSKQFGGELVSFLVPVQFAVELLKQARPTGSIRDFRGDVAAQMTAWQALFFQSFDRAGYRSATFGPYRAPESRALWFTCWARTNTEQRPLPRATVYSSYCNSESRIFIANDLSSGHIFVSQSLVRNIDLNAYQFARFLTAQAQPFATGARPEKWFTGERCRNDYVTAGPGHPPLQLSWCARAYRDLGDLFDVWVTAITQDRTDQALVSRLTLEAIDYGTAETLGKRFIEQIRWNK